MTNLDSILKSRDITLPTKVHLVKAMVFPVVMYRCESWTIKTAEHWRIDAFELWCWRRLLSVPWTARRSSQSDMTETLNWTEMNEVDEPGSYYTEWSKSERETSVLPMNTRDWSPLGWTGWISLQSKGLSRVFSNTTVKNHQFFSDKPFL